MIAVLTPSRRYYGLIRMRQSIASTATAVNIYSDSGLYPEYMPTVHKWNMLAHEALKDERNKLFMLGADDIIFETPNWDKALLDHYNNLANKVHCYALQDSRDVDGCPHPLVSREYIRAMGYFLPPLYTHWYVDTWTRDIARSNHCFTHFKDYKLTHVKPSDHGAADETHMGIRRMGWHDADTYTNKTCQHFLEVEKQRLAKAMT